MSDPIRSGDFWSGPLEAETYLEAVRQNPQREGEGNLSYIARLSDVVTGEAALYEARIDELRSQAKAL